MTHSFILYLPIKHKDNMQMAYRWAGQKGSKSCSYNCPQYESNVHH